MNTICFFFLTLSFVRVAKENTLPKEENKPKEKEDKPSPAEASTKTTAAAAAPTSSPNPSTVTPTPATTPVAQCILPGLEAPTEPVSANAFASGANMNGAQVMTGRPTSRVRHPGGVGGPDSGWKLG